MKALFCYDHRFMRVDANVYTYGYFPSTVWSRYLEIFSHVTVIGRELVGSYHGDLIKSSADGVDFVIIGKGGVRDFNKVHARNVMLKLMHDADVIIARLPSEYGLLAAQLSKRQGKPCVVEVVGSAWDGYWHHGSHLGKLYAPIAHLRCRAAVAQANYAIYVTKDYLQSLYPCKGLQAVCSNVEIKYHDKAVLERREAKIHEMGSSKIILGLIGSLNTNQKGIQTVIRALPAVTKAVPNVQFRILGGGDASRWNDLAETFGVSDFIKFDGVRTPGDEVLKWLDIVDLYLQPSLQEGLPRALIEAMSRGCPAIGTRCAGIPELLDDDALVDQKDHDYLGKLIVKVLRNKHWLRSHSRRNFERSADYVYQNINARRSSLLRAAANNSAMVKG